MIKKYIFIAGYIACLACTTPKEQQQTDFTTLFEKSNGTETDIYKNVIQFYTDMAKAYPTIHIQAIGETDSGFPLHLVIFNPEMNFHFETIQNKKTTILINNGIHPGESDGIDATMMLFRDLAQNKITPPKNIVLATIPVYNIGGALNRNSTTRANQNGPEEYGFRGNARNYDLNRDFIKSDTKNARAFAKIYHLLNPDVFIDNHVSNGADYQYALTHLFTQHNKLGGETGTYLHTVLQPELEKKLAEKNWDITPYVNVFNTVPETGFPQFFDSSRYSTGYTTLWNTLGLMVETHMLKPYKQRVEGTYELMKSMIGIVDADHKTIKELRIKDRLGFRTGKKYAIQWEVDTTRYSTLNFKGYEGKMIPSEVTGQQRLKYFRDKPFIKEVTYQNYFKPVKEVSIPKAYIIPAGQWNVTELLQANNIVMLPIGRDTIIKAEGYKIKGFETRKKPFEGHYTHYNTEVISFTDEIRFLKGDFIVYTDQPGIRYLIETLEPEATDSFFNWNFFDAILQQKEHFSPYVFEDVAKKMLEDNEQLKTEFELKKQNDKAFSSNWYAQLNWLYERSEHLEKPYLRYPVYRLFE